GQGGQALATLEGAAEVVDRDAEGLGGGVQVAEAGAVARAAMAAGATGTVGRPGGIEGGEDLVGLRLGDRALGHEAVEDRLGPVTPGGQRPSGGRSGGR